MIVSVLQRQQDELPGALSFATYGSDHGAVQSIHHGLYSNQLADIGTEKLLTEPPIIDIRTGSAPQLDLRQQCLDSLQKPVGQKSLPSLLLWDEQGQILYEDIIKNDAYYPLRAEQQLLKRHVGDFAQAIANSGVQMLIELGAGSMQKTSSILSALDEMGKELTYYALDVDYKALLQSLDDVRSKVSLKNITVKGLCGTYDDGARWLSLPENHQNRRQAILWLGNSIANFEVHEATAVLAAFLNHNTPEHLGGIIFTVDGCHDVPTLQQAYNIPNGATRRWLSYGLRAAQKCLGPESLEFLHSDNWEFDLRWEAERGRFENYLVATNPLKTKIGQVELEVERGEHVKLIGSGKWKETQIQKICSKQGLQMIHRWQSPVAPYDMYWLQPAPPV